MSVSLVDRIAAASRYVRATNCRKFFELLMFLFGYAEPAGTHRRSTNHNYFPLASRPEALHMAMGVPAQRSAVS